MFGIVKAGLPREIGLRTVVENLESSRQKISTSEMSRKIRDICSDGRMWIWPVADAIRGAGSIDVIGRVRKGGRNC